MITHTTPADGNIFEELGAVPEEAANLKIRSQMMFEIDRHIRQLGITAKEAATLFNTSRDRIESIVKGHIDECTIDDLVMMLVHAGLDVSISIVPRKAA